MKIFLILIFSFNVIFAEEIYASFNVEASRQSKLAIESIGIVSQIPITIGQKVKKGDLLIALDQTSEKIALENAKNSYNLALAQYENTKSKMKKINSVQDVIDKQSYEDMKTQFNIASLNLTKAKINIDYYKNILEKKELRAPYDAIVSNKFIQIGEGVGGVAQPLVEIFSYPQSKLILSFDEKYKDKVKIGDEFIYKLDQSNNQIKGKISLIYPSIEVKTRKIYAEVEASGLTPGLFGEGKIITKD
ncbi:efflux RND transporter periplasmic adaptor subunit [Campylobacter sp. RM10532]|uniref:Efflux RND transporter periplasmic adaptor subunit n=1 Tax=Campylobacter molothri TaxID=1032242 RepID=A0ACC5W3B1_9BACT|nr:efflux RND transporter periplasmic adaptor subunit [Campylobacter sp. RM10542]MBZ7930121.1 efflux RND transporter periplasmic adaptor subunit [Campylobacter sp. W0067]MBZ7945194.1 efflux RND transporter periplasmic adaptor subunit [Campylobacter sp. RM10532]MBZ7946714.1 efflux RND transporter periplasmic adaptor subunit [Campylobacter sp. RM10536]MBZ7952624.1 efflux RND transporter periplasmic adaptor subunit [Campylobacter sp. RM9939]MBZ7956395.1 efflux RND transporter periplasmic adaptor 